MGDGLQLSRRWTGCQAFLERLFEQIGQECGAGILHDHRDGNGNAAAGHCVGAGMDAAVAQLQFSQYWGSVLGSCLYYYTIDTRLNIPEISFV